MENYVLIATNFKEAMWYIYCRPEPRPDMKQTGVQRVHRATTRILAARLKRV